jgi:hypothetical protein
VERAFKTFLHSHVEVMAGYLGHSVADRKDIEARRSFADRLHKKLKTPGETVSMNISPEELQRVCDAWADNVYGNEAHSGLGGMTPNQRAADWRGRVFRVENERALDLLFMPVPGNDGIRTVSKKGLRITPDLHGLKLRGHYIGVDLAALVGQRVLCCMDDDCPGRVYMYHPETDEYLGKAEHPGLMGWTGEQVREVALAAARRQKAELAAAGKEWKEASRQANVANIANEILAAAAFRVGKEYRAGEEVAKHVTVAHVTPALKQAKRALAGDFAPPSDEERARVEASVAHLMEPAKPAGFVVPENGQARVELWRELYDRHAAGGELDGEARRWFHSFARTIDCKAYCAVHGLTPPAQAA